MAIPFTSAGTTLYISAGVPATIDAAGFGALTYTKVAEVTDLSSIGPEIAVVEHTPIDSGVKYKLKTIKDNGTMSVKGARQTSDAGQILLSNAVGVYAPYAIKIVLQNGTIIFAQALISSYKTVIGTAGVVTTFESNFNISGEVVTV